MAYMFCYRRAWDEFRKRSNHKEAFLQHIFASPEKFAYPDAKSCVSYGAGAGDVDRILIQKILPGLTTYYGNEPDKDNFPTLKETMRDLTTDAGQVKCQFSKEGAEEDKGPEEKVDIMFMFHMLQYLKDPADFLNQCWEKLSPGGIIMIVLREGPRCDIAKYKKIIGDVVKAKPAEDIVRNIREVLNAVGFSKVENYPFQTEIDIRQVNIDLVSFLLMRTPSKEEMDAFKLLEKYLQDVGEKVALLKDNNVFICQK